MTSSDLSENLSNSPSDIKDIARLKFLTMMRLGLFQMGLGMMAILTLGILNRVMIGELGIPAIVTAGAIAMHQFVAPARVWFGQMSDNKPIAGKHRTNYILLGAIGFTCAVFLAVQVMWRLGDLVQTNGGWLWSGETWLWTALLALVFAGYGLALSASSTPFAALLVDVSEEHNRSKVVGVVWSMLMVGIVIGGITGGILLKNIADPAIVTGANIGTLLLTGQQGIPPSLEALKSPINFLFMVMPLGVFGLALIATWGIEDKYSHYTNRSSASSREDSVTLGRAIKVLTASRQTGIFFTFLLVMTVSLFMQEAVLEPYGGEVFQMPIAATTQLNAFWGMGTLIGVSTTGFLIVPRLGKQNTAKLGCGLTSISFILIIVAGFSQSAGFLQTVVFLFGLAAGITTTGAISLMLDLTVAATAGTFIGAWGLAQAMARAIATVSGGAVLDLGRLIFPSPVLAYGLVFALQAVGMIIAIALLSRVNIKEFQDSTTKTITTVLQEDLG